MKHKAALVAAGTVGAPEDDGWGNEVEEIQKKVSKMGTTDEQKIDAASGAIADVTSPLLTNLGFSGAMGLSVAIALKTLGAVVATVVGFGFILVQLGAYFGILDVNWSKLGDVATQALDVTGDGKVGKEDVQLLAKKFIGFASFGLPSVGGFITGLLLGLKVF